MSTKKDIVKRLVEAGHIDFDEALLLMETEKEIIYPPYYPTIHTPLVYDGTAPYQTITITSTDNDSTAIVN